MSGIAPAQSTGSDNTHGARPCYRGRGSFVLLALILGTASACRGGREALVLASTTSTEDSGLLDRLLPAFTAATPAYDVRLVAVGSGQALQLGERGDADVLLVHSPREEARFMANGSGNGRWPVMRNEFVIVGPAADPAGARGVDAVAALGAIARSRSPFMSRGDDSGTHRKELTLWQRAGISPEREPWYADVGQGMAETLTVARERGGYTLTDIATYLFLKQPGGLSVLVEGDSALVNHYSVIVASRARNKAGARAFASWITSPAAQRLIGEYGRAEFGRALFTPVADMTSEHAGEVPGATAGGHPVSSAAR